MRNSEECTQGQNVTTPHGGPNALMTIVTTDKWCMHEYSRQDKTYLRHKMHDEIKEIALADRGAARWVTYSRLYAHE